MKASVGVSIVLAVLMGLTLAGGNSLSISSGIESQSSSGERISVSRTSDPWWAEDSKPYDFGSPYETEDSNPYDFNSPFEPQDSDPYDFSSPYEKEDSDPYDFANPLEIDKPDPYEIDSPWWTGASDPYEIDDPWNGTTNGCSFGICDDDSFLVDCSYVTVGISRAEGACDGPLGMTRFDNCYPVSGSAFRSGSNSQTFRCVDEPGYQRGGYSLTDIAPVSSDNVALLLCSGESAFGVSSCEDAPAGIKYYTCELDTRVMPPIGSEKEWYICEK